MEETQRTALQMVLISLNILNVVVHGLGTTLLFHQYHNGRKIAQRLFILNLSVCELIYNLVEMLRRIPLVVPSHLDRQV